MYKIIKLEILSATLMLGIFSFSGGARAAQIAVNSIGFFPVANKVATVRGTAASFDVVHAITGETVFSGSTATDWDAEEDVNVKLLDFSAFETRGTYFLRTDADDTSATFRIREGVYNDSYKLAMAGMYLMRCGTAVSYEHNGDLFEHGICHTNDANMSKSGIIDPVHGTSYTTDMSGGWHDAGDYNKYIFNGAFSAGVLYKTWDMHQSKIQDLDLGNAGTDPAVPDFLEECKWETDWILKMQQTNGMLHNIVGHCPTCWSRIQDPPAPHNDGMSRYATPAATAGTGYGCAVLAMAVRNFAPYLPAYSTLCSNAAVAAWNAIYDQPTIDPVGSNTVLKYHDTDYQSFNGRVWAAAEIYELNGDTTAQNYFENNWHSHGKFANQIGWASGKQIGFMTYFSSARIVPEKAAMKGSLNGAKETYVSKSINSPYDQGMDNYAWGYNSTLASISMLFHVHKATSAWADGLTGSEHSRKIIDYLLGRNRYARSFVTGMGHNPPENPHDRRSTSDNIEAPWPGALVGGKNPIWLDNQGDYFKNEITINGMVCLISALAGTVDKDATPNVPPQITSIAPANILADVAFSYAVGISDPDTTDVLEIIVEPLPSWVQLDSTSNILWGTPSVAHIGTNTFTLVATDGFSTTTQQVTLAVLPGFPDTDADGLDDNWETTFFGNITVSDGTIDSDGDGHNDASEFQAGSIPNDSTSQFKITNINTPTGQTALVELRWPSAMNRTYKVIGTETLQNGFTNSVVESMSIFATPPTNTWTDDLPDAGAYFYRIILE